MNVRCWSVFVLCLISAGPVLAGTEVETVAGTVTLVVDLPGTLDGGGGVDFDGQALITSLDFAPGSVLFEGMPVDFDGTEADFLVSNYNGTGNVPVLAGPATVTVTGSGAVTPPVDIVTTFETNNLQLGPGFGIGQIDVVQGSANTTSATGLWSSALVPELNGFQVTFQKDGQVIVVDAIGGLIDYSFTGSIFAEVPSVPTLTPWGLTLLAAGLLLLLGYAVIRRQREQPAAGAGA